MILYSSIHPSIHASILSAKMCSAYDRNDSVNLKAKKKKKRLCKQKKNFFTLQSKQAINLFMALLDED